MKKMLAMIFATFMITGTAYASPHGIEFSYLKEDTRVTGPQFKKQNLKHNRNYKTTKHKNYAKKKPVKYEAVRHYAKFNAGAKPAKWCGWYARTMFGGGPEYNRARLWANRGRPSGPQIGAVVVWPHHVGVIVGKAANGQWLVHSGNDSNRVRTRPRSVAGAIAFRML